MWKGKLQSLFRQHSLTRMHKALLQKALVRTLIYKEYSYSTIQISGNYTFSKISALPIFFRFIFPKTPKLKANNIMKNETNKSDMPTNQEGYAASYRRSGQPLTFHQGQQKVLFFSVTSWFSTMNTDDKFIVTLFWL